MKPSSVLMQYKNIISFLDVKTCRENFNGNVIVEGRDEKVSNNMELN